MTNIVDNLRTLETSYAEAKKVFINNAKKEISKSFVEVFEKYPEIKGICWCQYTPYFNDGEPCEFRVNEIYVTDFDLYDENGDCLYDSVYDVEGELYKNKFKVPEEVEKFTSILYSDMEEVLKEMFGDHVQIFVTQKGIDVQEFEHD